MRFIASGDHHWQFDGRRWTECVRVHDWIAAEVERRQPDVFMSGGDIFEHESVPQDRLAVAAWLTRIAEVCPVIIAKGNHDRERDLGILGKLSTKHPIIIEEGAGVHIIAGAAIAAVAWPRRANLIADGSFGTDAGAERRALRAVFGGLRDELEAFDGPRIALGHFMVDGAKSSTGQPICGAEMNVGLEDLALIGAQIGVMAHIHAPSAWDVAGADFIYTGSPFRADFGEMEEKSILVGEVTKAGATWERIATPATPMVHVDVAVQPNGTLHADVMPDVVGAEVRLRVRGKASERDAMRELRIRLAASLIEAGALSVKHEDVVTAETRARAPEVAKAATLADKLPAYWASKGMPITGERLARLLEKTNKLEGAVL